ncbi:conjugal transfer protein [Acidithiobacillus thiooxidans]|uniref:Conjugal transfer protein n=1 Tax=Acidithiobacillus thiooxidans TaxID=930 RepID=A0A1C2IJT6_ACITH|nr:VirB8/TrbF family protein [Acidithiobacillus thiooxidans]OCX71658.1 conjugal transfer protein [Acidithiobacillus thiooxidans]OCX76277.1 conjugal transfer protein [Acidithiobacillus thiooxidans]OCX78471.1 conjugal transfer protein [Acidithiobacillus thiooxidans]OCX89252.1 conjugal transfer protein [Acidithiobacillus thiooxidans]OFC42632.1 conjugal transfer protein [Acidithiobacillus thiooxidans]
MAENDSGKERYLAARREWLERYGDYIASAKNWRAMAFGSLVIAGIFGAGMVYEADRVHIIPYVVEVNHLGDAVHLAQAVNAGTYQQPIVRHVLTHWLRLVREQIPVVAAEKQAYNEAYNYTSSSAEPALNAFFQRHNPYMAYTKRRGARTITITSALPQGPLTSKGGTFDIQWTEKQYSRSGAITGTTHWQGMITYAITKPSTNPNVLNGNPFGIYVTNFSWNQTI